MEIRIRKTFWLEKLAKRNVKNCPDCLFDAIKYTYKLQIMVTKVKAFMQYKLLNKSKIFPTFIRYVLYTNI